MAEQAVSVYRSMKDWQIILFVGVRLHEGHVCVDGRRHFRSRLEAEGVTVNP